MLFNSIPKGKLLVRSAPIYVGMVFFMIAVVGIIRGKESKTLFQSGISAYSEFVFTTMYPPVICSGSKNLTDYQKKLCETYSSQRNVGLITLLIPFFVLFLVFRYHMGLIRSVYLSANEELEEKKSPRGIGEVLEEAPPSVDAFRYFFGFKSISVKGEKGKAVTVIFPFDYQFPKPGTRIQVYRWSPPIGQKKYLGVEHHPELKVFRGVRG